MPAALAKRAHVKIVRSISNRIGGKNGSFMISVVFTVVGGSGKYSEQAEINRDFFNQFFHGLPQMIITLDFKFLVHGDPQVKN